MNSRIPDRYKVQSIFLTYLWSNYDDNYFFDETIVQFARCPKNKAALPPLVDATVLNFCSDACLDN